jgi:hypothetical protein
MTHDQFPHSADNKPDPELEPTSEGTKKELLELVKANRNGGEYVAANTEEDDDHPHPSYLISRLYSQSIPGTEYNVGYVFEEDRMVINGETMTGWVNQTNKVTVSQEDGQAGFTGLEERRNYKLFLTPDGTLEIEKVVYGFDQKEFGRETEEFWIAWEQGDEERLEESRAKSRSRMEDAERADLERKQRGMGFVPEYEAHELLERLREAKPYSPK